MIPCEYAESRKAFEDLGSMEYSLSLNLLPVTFSYSDLSGLANFLSNLLLSTNLIKGFSEGTLATSPLSVTPKCSQNSLKPPSEANLASPTLCRYVLMFITYLK